MTLTYTNKKGKEVSVDVSWHAKLRFKQRFFVCFKKNLSWKSVEDLIVGYFADAVRVNPLGKGRPASKRKEDRSTIFLRRWPFVFVVRDATLVTVRIDKNVAKKLRCGGEI